MRHKVDETTRRRYISTVNSWRITSVLTICWKRSWTPRDSSSKVHWLVV